MIDYQFQGRLNYIPGGALNVQMSAWPAAGGNWWEPSTGSYTVVAAYQAKGAASLAASYVNLANPGTYDLTAIDAPSFNTATGWTFDSSDRLYSNASASNKPATYIARIKTDGTSGYRTVVGGGGMTDQSGALSIDLTTGTDIMRVLKMNEALIGTSSSAPPSGTDTVIAVTYSGAGAYVFYIDGSAVGSGTNNQTLTAGRTLMIGGQTTPGGFVQPYKGDILAVATYSTVLDATQVAEITDNMEAL